MASPPSTPDLVLSQLLSNLQTTNVITHQVRNHISQLAEQSAMAPLSFNDTWAMISRLHVSNIEGHRALLERFAHQLQSDGGGVDPTVKTMLNDFYKHTGEMLAHAKAVQTYYEHQSSPPNIHSATPPQNGATERPSKQSTSRKRNLEFEDEDKDHKSFPATVAVKKLKQALDAPAHKLDESVEDQPAQQPTTHVQYEDISAETHRRVREAHERRKAKRAAETGAADAKEDGKRKRDSTESVDSGIAMSNSELKQRTKAEPKKKKLKVTEKGLKSEVKAKVAAESKAKVVKSKGKRAAGDEGEEELDGVDSLQAKKKARRQEREARGPVIWVDDAHAA